MKLKNSRKIAALLICVVLFQLAAVGYLIIYYRVVVTYSPRIFSKVGQVPFKYTVIVLGAGVKSDGTLSTALLERLEKAVQLYEAGCVEKFLLTGDHRNSYDEVNTMRKYLESCKIPKNRIFLDSAGFCTYDSLVRGNKIFRIKDAVIVSQAFHLPRAVYIACNVGINAAGCNADRYWYNKSWFIIREQLAMIKDYFSVNLEIPPKFLGEAIPIYGDGFKSWDKHKEGVENGEIKRK